MKRVPKLGKLVVRDDLFAGTSRQVKVQPENCDVYDFASWVVAGLGSVALKPFVVYMPKFGGRGHPDYKRHEFDAVATDLTNHNAFCAGHMPAYAYADWLEETGVPLPAAAFRILRGQV
jgi:hypothetical protein